MKTMLKLKLFFVFFFMRIKERRLPEIIETIIKIYQVNKHKLDMIGLVNALYFVECHSSDNLDDFATRSQYVEQGDKWNAIQKKLADLGKIIDDCSGRMDSNLLSITARKMNDNPAKVQLCCVFTGLMNDWLLVKYVDLTYEMLIELCSISHWDLRHEKRILEALFSQNVAAILFHLFFCLDFRRRFRRDGIPEGI